MPQGGDGMRLNLGFQGPAQQAGSQRALPAGGIAAEVGAPPVALAGGVQLDRTLGRAHDAMEPALGVVAAAEVTFTQRNGRTDLQIGPGFQPGLHDLCGFARARGVTLGRCLHLRAVHHLHYLLDTYFSRRMWCTDSPNSFRASKLASTMFGLPHR